jgi:hypothetical protein
MVRTHTFKLGKYHIHIGGPVMGCCDLPDDGKTVLHMHILDGNTLEALDVAIHEALHAMGIPDRHLHNSDGSSRTVAIARFLWRLGWRRAE